MNRISKAIRAYFIKTVPFEEELLKLIQEGNLEQLAMYIETKNINPQLFTKVKLT